MVFANFFIWECKGKKLQCNLPMGMTKIQANKLLSHINI